MAIVDALLAELEQEVADDAARARARARRRICRGSRIRSRCRSGSSRCTSRRCPGNVAELAAMDTVPEPPAFVQPEAATAAELVPALTASVAKAREHLGGFDDAAMGATWRLMSGGRELMAMPRAAFVRAIMLNHWYHHRGQLLVYLRLLDVPVPSVYGPTADENPFAAPPAARPDRRRLAVRLPRRRLTASVKRSSRPARIVNHGDRRSSWRR